MATSRSSTSTDRNILRAATPLMWAVAAFGLVTDPAPAAGVRYVPERILVKPKADLSEAEFAARLTLHGGRAQGSIPKLKIHVISVPEDKAEALLTRLQRDPQIEYAERDYLAEAALAPNDPLIANGPEWHLDAIHAPEAWDHTIGNASTIVAVLDSGVNPAHPDLSGRLVPGYDFVWGDSDPTDDYGHGTAVAGVIAAAGNNGIGVAGVAYGARVMPVKVMNASGLAAYSTIAQGIRYAVDNGARVINISIAGTSLSATLQSAIDYAWSSNVVVVAAAGNSGNSTPLYPAACSNVAAVSATLADDSRAGFSSYGSHIALAAPGNAIWTTSRDLATGYSAWSGTSFACPVVAGVAALVASAKPELTIQQVVSVLEQSADDLGTAGWDSEYGHGRVNAANAVRAALAQDFSLPTASVLAPAPGEGVSGQVNIEVAAAGSAPVQGIQCYANGRLIGSSAGTNGSFVWLTTALTNGAYLLQAKATDAAGKVGYSTAVLVNVVNSMQTPPTIIGLTKTGNGGLVLNWEAIPNRSYRVQSTLSLATPNWQDCSGDVISAGTNASFTVPSPDVPQCFYRIRSTP